MTEAEPPDHDLETRLIRAGMREAPPSDTLQRTLTGLGLGASAIAAASSAGALGATKATTSIGVLGLVKWASVGAASGLMVTAATYGVQHATRPVSRSTPSSAAVSGARDRPMSAASTATRELLPVAAPSALALPSAAPATPSRAAPATEETDAPLAIELAFVDRGREVFQRNEPLAALSLLEGYERSFPKPRLMPEVLYLRMAAHRQRGENERAIKLAERLVRDFPRSPHASSARSILDATSAP